ncbi:MAG: NAD-dependent epimerase/dehydratase family protein [Pseudomonadales bacterium]|nr:NAD-dependent epimerase/dehydratase family protein [Pseudomonadales bacterium]
MDRRELLQVSAAGLLTAAAGDWVKAQDAGPKPLKILILGGTRFIGIHMAELAIARGHRLTFFNRGRTKSDLFPEVERILGDRNGKLDGLRDRQWDAVIDNSGYVPRHVRLSAELLAPNVGQYVFISSISVYPDFSKPRDEQSPVGKILNEAVEEVDAETYGPLKALCEVAAESAMPGRTTVLRPGLIVGPHDNTDRFTYWPARAAMGGEFIAPGSPRDSIQFIDARDLAQFALEAIERRIVGTFNVTSPPGRFTMGGLIDAAVSSAGRFAKPVLAPLPMWMPPDFLAAHNVEPWSDMPVWLPAEGQQLAFAETRVDKALDAGLQIRALQSTMDDTLNWYLSRPEAERTKLKAGIDRTREDAVLAAWHARTDDPPELAPSP